MGNFYYSFWIDGFRYDTEISNNMAEKIEHRFQTVMIALIGHMIALIGLMQHIEINQYIYVAIFSIYTAFFGFVVFITGAKDI